MTGLLATLLTERLGCRLPVIQTAMGWIATPQLVAASSQAGMFGFLAGAVMRPDELSGAIDAVRRATDKNFGVNFHMFQPGAAEIIDLIIANRDRVAAVSFGRGPDAKAIGRFRDAGILCIPTVGAVKHATKMAELGCDIIVVQGGEGGGHTGSIPSTVLLPQVLDTVKIPVVAAGGFADGRGLAAALAYGAVGIAMGSRFLMTRESPLPEAVKQRYQQAGTEDIKVSTRIDGMPQRMIVNEAVDRIERSSRIGMWLRAIEAGMAMKSQTGASWGDLYRTARGMTTHGGLSLPRAMMAAAAPMLIQRAVVDGDAAHGIMATGLVAGRLIDLPRCADLADQIEAEALARIAALSTPERRAA